MFYKTKGTAVAKNPPKLSEKDRERQHQLALKRWDVISILGKYFLVVVGIAASLFVGIALPILFSSGKATGIEYTINWIADFQLHVWIAWGAAATATVVAAIERRKRIKERGEKDERIIKLERGIDPNRGSSGLTPEGEES